MPSAFTIVGLGEALFDIFLDRAILGGAPLNVAYHAHQLCSPTGGQGIAASAVGTDELGQRLLSELRVRGLSIEFVCVDPLHPTGRVDITLSQGEPNYQFLDDVAWDHLEWTDAWQTLATRCDGVVFGTLAQRAPKSRETIWQFVTSAMNAERLFDVNLRVNFFDAESLNRGARLATAIKLNEDELPIVLQLLGISDMAETGHNTNDATALIAQILARFTSTGLRRVVLTRGSLGTELHTRDGVVRAAVPQFSKHPMADNVGAGDACSAGLLWGWLNHWPPEQTVALANRLGAFVASQPGATPAWPDHLITP